MTRINENSTIADLKQYLQDTIEYLELNFDDEQKLNLESNTYFLGSCSMGFLGIEGNHGGYINLEDPVASQEDEDYNY